MAAEATQTRRSLLAPEIERWADPDVPVMRLVDVTKSYDGRPIIDGLSLDVTTGETTVIMGRSGNGKTVLVKLMSGLIRADSGRVELFGENLTTVSEVRLVELRKRIAVVFQNYALFDDYNVRDNIAFPLRQNSQLDDAEIVRRADELLEMLKLPHAALLMPNELSGGMKKRVSFARAVVTQPELVLFDEPTTGLDPVMIKFVDDLIIKTQEHFGISSVIISHDMASIFRLAQRVAVLDQGRIVEVCTPGDLRTSKNAVVVDFLAATAGAAREVENSEEPGPPAVVFTDIHKSFGSAHVLKGVSFRVPPGEITVVIGASGSGKSVIIKHLMGLLKPDSGSITVFGDEVTGHDDRQWAKVRERIGMVFQHSALLDALTVEENVAFPLVERRKLKRAEINQRVSALLARLKLSDVAKKWPGEVSAGVGKRVALACALITEPELMIYDEPTTGQDPTMIKAVDEMVVEANREFGITSIVISHDMESTFRIVHRVAMLHRGEILAFGPPDAVWATPHPEVRKFVNARGPAPEAAI